MRIQMSLHVLISLGLAPSLSLCLSKTMLPVLNYLKQQRVSVYLCKEMTTLDADSGHWWIEISSLGLLEGAGPRHNQTARVSCLLSDSGKRIDLIVLLSCCCCCWSCFLDAEWEIKSGGWVCYLFLMRSQRWNWKRLKEIEETTLVSFYRNMN